MKWIFTGIGIYFLFAIGFLIAVSIYAATNPKWMEQSWLFRPRPETKLSSFLKSLTIKFSYFTIVVVALNGLLMIAFIIWVIVNAIK